MFFKLILAALLTCLVGAGYGYGQGVTVERSSGRVDSIRSRDLRRFDRPLSRPNIARPPVRRGGDWRWHQSFGWIWLPTGVGGGVEILPPNFVLPPTVDYWNSGPTVRCPHCGRSFSITIR